MNIPIKHPKREIGLRNGGLTDDAFAGRSERDIPHECIPPVYLEAAFLKKQPHNHIPRLRVAPISLLQEPRL